MIINLLINAILLSFGLLLQFLPSATIADIPIIGETVSSIMIFAVTHWNSVIDTFPYFDIVWTLFLYIVIPFEVGLLVLRFFLGHRTPIAK